MPWLSVQDFLLAYCAYQGKAGPARVRIPLDGKEILLMMQAIGCDFAVVVPLGPGKQEEGRLDALLESLAFHEPGRCFVVIVDDEACGRPLAESVRRHLSGRFIIVRNPRQGRGS